MLVTANIHLCVFWQINTKIHRAYVVDEKQRPVGVIGHGEILKAVETSLDVQHRPLARAVSNYF